MYKWRRLEVEFKTVCVGFGEEKKGQKSYYFYWND